MAVTVDIYYDERYFRKKTKDYPVKLRVYSGDPRLYPTIYGLTHEEIESLSQKRVSDALADLRKKFKDLEKRATDAADAIIPFDFDEFERDFIVGNSEIDETKLKIKPVLPADQPFDFEPYYKKFPILLETPEDGTFGQVFLSMIKYKVIIGKVTTALSYQASYISLVKFGGNRPFQKVTPRDLHMYGEWMKELGNSKTSTGIYLRNLRSVFNEADNLKIIKKDKCYPFGRKKYRIPGTRNIKKTYEIEELQKAYYYECAPSKPWLQRAKDFVFFIFFGNGLNPLDICKLQRKNMVDDLIIFERAKTEETAKEDPPKIVICIDDDLWQIIERQCARDENGNINEDPESYLFPIFQPGMTPLEEYERRQLFIEFINKWLTFIFKEVGVNKKGRCYDLRHSFASVQRFFGASTDDIQELLGQADPRTAKRYVASLPIEQMRVASSRLNIIKKRPNPIEDSRA
jgi:integrase/recombinase XerD